MSRKSLKKWLSSSFGSHPSVKMADFTECFFRYLKGFECVNSDVSSKKKSKIILVHGFIQNHKSWLSTGKELQRIGHDVVLIDLVGHGRNMFWVLNEGHRPTVDTYAEQVRHIVLTLGWENSEITLGGISMGGATIMHYLNKYGTNSDGSTHVSRIVLVATAGRAERWYRLTHFFSALSRFLISFGYDCIGDTKYTEYVRHKSQIMTAQPAVLGYSQPKNALNSFLSSAMRAIASFFHYIFKVSAIYIKSTLGPGPSKVLPDTNISWSKVPLLVWRWVQCSMYAPTHAVSQTTLSPMELPTNLRSIAVIHGSMDFIHAPNGILRDLDILEKEYGIKEKRIGRINPFRVSKYDINERIILNNNLELETKIYKWWAHSDMCCSVHKLDLHLDDIW